MIKQLRAQDVRVAYLSLSRNFGHQNALFAGMSAATSDAVITMDADLLDAGNSRPAFFS